MVYTMPFLLRSETMNDFTILSNQVETCIQELIDQTFQNEDLRNIFPNRLLREDVLDLLDRYCTVVYYPLEEGIL